MKIEMLEFTFNSASENLNLYQILFQSRLLHNSRRFDYITRQALKSITLTPQIRFKGFSIQGNKNRI